MGGGGGDDEDSGSSSSSGDGDSDGSEGDGGVDEESGPGLSESLGWEGGSGSGSGDGEADTSESGGEAEDGDLHRDAGCGEEESEEESEEEDSEDGRSSSSDEHDLTAVEAGTRAPGAEDESGLLMWCRIKGYPPPPHWPMRTFLRPGELHVPFLGPDAAHMNAAECWEARDGRFASRKLPGPLALWTDLDDDPDTCLRPSRALTAGAPLPLTSAAEGVGRASGPPAALPNDGAAAAAAAAFGFRISRGSCELSLEEARARAARLGGWAPPRSSSSSQAVAAAVAAAERSKRAAAGGGEPPGPPTDPLLREALLREVEAAAAAGNASAAAELRRTLDHYCRSAGARLDAAAAPTPAAAPAAGAAGVDDGPDAELAQLRVMGPTAGWTLARMEAELRVQAAQRLAGGKVVMHRAPVRHPGEPAGPYMERCIVYYDAWKAFMVMQRRKRWPRKPKPKAAAAAAAVMAAGEASESQHGGGGDRGPARATDAAGGGDAGGARCEVHEAGPGPSSTAAAGGREGGRGRGGGRSRGRGAGRGQRSVGDGASYRAWWENMEAAVGEEIVTPAAGQADDAGEAAGLTGGAPPPAAVARGSSQRAASGGGGSGGGGGSKRKSSSSSSSSSGNSSNADKSSDRSSGDSKDGTSSGRTSSSSSDSGSGGGHAHSAGEGDGRSRPPSADGAPGSEGPPNGSGTSSSSSSSGSSSDSTSSSDGDSSSSDSSSNDSSKNGASPQTSSSVGVTMSQSSEEEAGGGGGADARGVCVNGGAGGTGGGLPRVDELLVVPDPDCDPDVGPQDDVALLPAGEAYFDGHLWVLRRTATKLYAGPLDGAEGRMDGDENEDEGGGSAAPERRRGVVHVEDTLCCAHPGCPAVKRVHRPAGAPGALGPEQLAASGLRVWVVHESVSAAEVAQVPGSGGAGLGPGARPASSVPDFSLSEVAADAYVVLVQRAARALMQPHLPPQPHSSLRRRRSCPDWVDPALAAAVPGAPSAWEAVHWGLEDPDPCAYLVEDEEAEVRALAKAMAMRAAAEAAGLGPAAAGGANRSRGGEGPAGAAEAAGHMAMGLLRSLEWPLDLCIRQLASLLGQPAAGAAADAPASGGGGGLSWAGPAETRPPLELCGPGLAVRDTDQDMLGGQGQSS
ncbi:hypothetical protein GPECTOR_34g728 [Gonium pectorale]|uniref:Uncharacterized protein n=1 Tax=Gonium pectorale TaxID=33097 RepID=A0A150GCK7_GONPE|nr:hypothetical protein GPECTOR_34g728 [Gonium pectorale]|eukprot:KXZ47569.1 hypothetical protein GPECTOR_34g728 [Gonium pectorale]